MRSYWVLLTLGIIMLAPLPAARAWNNTGHMAIAYIAYQNLSGNTKQHIDSLLALHPDYPAWTNKLGILAQSDDAGVYYFMLASVWPDDIKQDPKHRFYDENIKGVHPMRRLPGFPDMAMHKRWHFIDTPYCTDGVVDPLTVHVDPENVVTRIKAFRAKLASQSEPNTFKAYDLSWLIHLVGDVHQPLHCISRYTHNHIDPKTHKPTGDRGGNAVTISDSSANLHAFWDEAFGTAHDFEIIQHLAEPLIEQGQPDTGSDLDTDDWLQESVSIAEEKVYSLCKDEPGDKIPTISPEYLTMATVVAQQRIALAGYRLAGVLNEVFGQE